MRLSTAEILCLVAFAAFIVFSLFGLVLVFVGG